MTAAVLTDWILRIALVFLSIISGYIATQFTGLSTSVQALNTNVAVLVSQQVEIANVTKDSSIIIRDHEKRITIIEQGQRRR